MKRTDMQPDGTLLGGWGQDVRPEKIGNTVHKEVKPNSGYVHELLAFLGEHSYSFAPNFLGLDDKGREIFEYIDGYTPHGQEVNPKTWSLETMTEIFKQIRALHDLTHNTKIAGDEECVCHGDLSYVNTVYRDGRAVGFIDWEAARPGKRIDDVAHALVQYLSIGEYYDEGPSERAELVRKLTDVYGLSPEERLILVDTMLEVLQTIRKIQIETIAKGTDAGKRFSEAGVPENVLERYNWLKENKHVFQAELK